MRDRVFVALDVETLDDAAALLDRLEGVVTGVKIGSQLFTGAGPAAVELALKRGYRVFLDLKFHDIPNTVAGAVRSATRLGVFMLNVHASGGADMMRRAAESAAQAAHDFNVTRPICLAVTVLTSLDRRALESEVGVPASVEAHVLRLAEHARDAGLDGCVASPQEIRRIRVALGPRFAIVTPGIRSGATPSGGGARSNDDQKRVATPRAAVRAGADYLVIGRPITGAADPKAAAAAIIADLATASP
ncbi:MAG: orotidine-5'-phosphate decarboxylase [Actinomycetota bacterium]